MPNHEIIEYLKTCPRAGSYVVLWADTETTILVVGRKDFVEIFNNHCSKLYLNADKLIDSGGLRQFKIEQKDSGSNAFCTWRAIDVLVCLDDPPAYDTSDKHAHDVDSDDCSGDTITIKNCTIRGATPITPF